MSSILQQLSSDMAASVSTASASVVRVEGRRRQAASGIVWSAGGLIVTAHHVVERDEVRVGLPDGQTAQGAVIGRDPTTDIALLRVQAEGLTPAVWAEAASVAVGQLVLAVGRPERAPQATLGVLSALDGEWRTMGGGAVSAFMQTDVVMYPGFSGGPLVGADGAMIGMNSSALVRGLSITLPAETLPRVVDALNREGRVRRGFLGVSAQPARLPAAAATEAGQETALLLISVEAGSPAEAAGMSLGDVLILLDGVRIRHMDDLLAVLAGNRTGKAVTARVMRGGKMLDLSVTIGERP